MTNEINKDWLESPFPQDHCPYCGEEFYVGFYREEDDDFDPIYWVSCDRCGKTWGQRYSLVFQYNFEGDDYPADWARIPLKVKTIRGE